MPISNVEFDALVKGDIVYVISRQYRRDTLEKGTVEGRTKTGVKIAFVSPITQNVTTYIFTSPWNYRGSNSRIPYKWIATPEEVEEYKNDNIQSSYRNKATTILASMSIKNDSKEILLEKIKELQETVDKFE